MIVKVEKLEKNMAKLTIEATAEQFEEALNKAYNKNKGSINVQGFRKGKAPRAMIEKMYGTGIFFEDAANYVINSTYPEALDSEEVKDLEIVSQPEIDITQIEKGKSFIYTAMVALKPEVTLGEYKNIEVEKQSTEVTEEEVNAELTKVREQNSRTITVDDRPVAMGDMVTIDFEGFTDGVAFEGGKGTDYELEIGSHSFVDTFEDQLVGKKIGEECEIMVTFPDEYHAENLAGKPAMFKVTVKGIKVKELPELNDELAEEISDFDTLAEYTADVKKKLEEKKQNEAEEARTNAIIEKIIENSTMDIPMPMIDSQAHQMLDEYAQRMQMQGLSLDMYMQYTGQTKEIMLEQMKGQASKRIQTRLVLEAIAEKEKIQISDDDLKAELNKMAETYKMEPEKLEELIGENEKKAIREDLAVQKAIEVIKA